MNYFINEDKCKELGISLQELFAILLVKSVKNIPKFFTSLVEKQVFHKDSFTGNIMVTQAWDDKACNALLSSEPTIPESDKIEALAQKLMDIFPKGKKPGTPYYFKGNKKDVGLKLKKFFKLYGDTYTEEQIINAAKKYVAAHTPETMRLLKYFIWKDIRKQDSEGKVYTEEVSDLADYITNEDTDISVDSNWTANLV